MCQNDIDKILYIKRKIFKPRERAQIMSDLWEGGV